MRMYAAPPNRHRTIGSIVALPLPLLLSDQSLSHSRIDSEFVMGRLDGLTV